MGCQHQARALYPLGRDPVLIVQEAERTPGLVQIGAENLAFPTFTGTDSRIFHPVASRYSDRAISVHPNGEDYTEINSQVVNTLIPEGSRAYCNSDAVGWEDKPKERSFTIRSTTTDTTS
jgi:hypothetical protein